VARVQYQSKKRNFSSKSGRLDEVLKLRQHMTLLHDNSIAQTFKQAQQR
jgi:hypothetical protein